MRERAGSAHPQHRVWPVGYHGHAGAGAGDYSACTTEFSVPNGFIAQALLSGSTTHWPSTMNLYS